MANENQKATPEGQPSEPQQKSRREFVKTSAQVAVTAPAVAMLLSSKTTLAADAGAYGASASHILDDFTFGNDHEDIDALKEHSNYSPLNGAPEKDDHYVPPPPA